jgi:predicted nucleic acid-binding protein
VTLYLDTSAVVKLYAAEAGSAEMHRLVSAASPIISSLITYVETRSALARKYHSGEIVVAAYETAKTEFEADWRIFSKIPPDSAIVRVPGRIVQIYTLRPT